MANPNKAVAAWRAKAGRDQKAIEATAKRVAESPMVIDMAKFQRGEMTAAEFQSKWNVK